MPGTVSVDEIVSGGKAAPPVQTVSPDDIAEAHEKTVAGFRQNLNTSSERLIESTAGAIAHPIDTAAGLFHLTRGIIEKGLTAAGMKPDPTSEKETKMVDALAQHYADNYGGWDRFKNALYEDPAGVVNDVVAMVTTAGAGIKAVQSLSHIPEVADVIAGTRALVPAAAPGVGKATLEATAGTALSKVPVVGPAVREGLGIGSGLQAGKTLKKAIETGVEAYKGATRAGVQASTEARAATALETYRKGQEAGTAAETAQLNEIAKALGAKDFESATAEQQTAIRKMAAGPTAPVAGTVHPDEVVTGGTPEAAKSAPLRPPWMPQPAAAVNPEEIGARVPAAPAAPVPTAGTPGPLRPPMANMPALSTPGPLQQEIEAGQAAAPAAAVPAAAPEPPPQIPPVNSKTVTVQAKPGGAFPEYKLMSEDGLRQYMAENKLDEPAARQALEGNGYAILNRSKLNRSLHGIGAELGLDHAAVSDIASQDFGVKSMSQLSQDQMLEMYEHLQGLQSASSPLMKKSATAGDLMSQLEASIKAVKAKKK